MIDVVLTVAIALLACIKQAVGPRKPARPALAGRWSHRRPFSKRCMHRRRIRRTTTLRESCLGVPPALVFLPVVIFVNVLTRFSFAGLHPASTASDAVAFAACGASLIAMIVLVDALTASP